MGETARSDKWRVERVPTGVPNLDRLIDGGLTRGGMMLIVGGPGTGKTVLAEQMAFHWISQGQRVLWVATPGEPNEKFLTHLSQMSYFDHSQVGPMLQLVNLTRFLHEGVEAQLEAIRETTRSGHYSFVVIDGFQVLRYFLGGPAETGLFLSELGSELALMGITLIVTIDSDPELHWESAEYTLADGIIALERMPRDGQEQRRLRIIKLRGRGYVEGTHSFSITRDGIQVHPRIESIVPQVQISAARERQPFGLPSLDRMLGGGMVTGTATLLLGPAGTGKSILAGHFLGEGIRQGQPGLYVSLFEDASMILRRSDDFGLPLRQAQEVGLLRLENHGIWQCDPDACAIRLAQIIEEQGTRRLVIDGIDPIEHELAQSQRTLEYVTAAVEYLRLKQVTSLFTYELPAMLSPALGFSGPLVGRTVANLILLRFIEREGRLRRLLTVVRTRYSQHSDVIAELLLTEGHAQIVEGETARREELAGVAVGRPS